MSETYNRREVLQAGALAAVAAGNAMAQQPKPGEPKSIRIGIVGTADAARSCCVTWCACKA